MDTLSAERYWEIEDYQQAQMQGRTPPSGITPPRQEEITIKSHMEPPARPSSGGSSGSSTSSTSRNTTGSGATAPQEQPSGVRQSSGGSGSGPTEAHGANLPRDTAATRDARAGGTASTGSGGTSTSSGSDSTGSTTETTPTPARSLWSQALRDERDRIEAAGGTMRDFRMPFEQHPQAGVFANYQAVAQPGRGPAVPNRMPGQPPPPAPFPQGPMPMANGLPQRGPAPAMPPPGAPPPGIFPQRGAAPAPVPFPQQPAAPPAPPLTNFSQRLQQLGAQPVMPPQYGAPPQFAGAPPQYGAPPMAPPPQVMPEPRPMQPSFGRTMPSAGFPTPPTMPPHDPFARY